MILLIIVVNFLIFFKFLTYFFAILTRKYTDFFNTRAIFFHFFINRPAFFLSDMDIGLHEFHDFFFIISEFSAKICIVEISQIFDKIIDDIV